MKIALAFLATWTGLSCLMGFLDWFDEGFWMYWLYALGVFAAIGAVVGIAFLWIWAVV